jgi:hypothetical protein
MGCGVEKGFGMGNTRGSDRRMVVCQKLDIKGKPDVSIGFFVVEGRTHLSITNCMENVVGNKRSDFFCRLIGVGVFIGSRTFAAAFLAEKRMGMDGNSEYPGLCSVAGWGADDTFQLPVFDAGNAGIGGGGGKMGAGKKKRGMDGNTGSFKFGNGTAATGI